MGFRILQAMQNFFVSEHFVSLLNKAQSFSSLSVKSVGSLTVGHLISSRFYVLRSKELGMAIYFAIEFVLGFGGGLCWPEVRICATSLSIRGQRSC